MYKVRKQPLLTGNMLHFAFNQEDSNSLYWLITCWYLPITNCPLLSQFRRILIYADINGASLLLSIFFVLVYFDSGWNISTTIEICENIGKNLVIGIHSSWKMIHLWYIYEYFFTTIGKFWNKMSFNKNKMCIIFCTFLTEKHPSSVVSFFLTTLKS